MQFPVSTALLTIGIVLAPSPASGADSPTFSDLLRQHAGATDSDLKRYAKSGLLARILPHARKGEVAAVGAVQIPVTLDFFLERFRDVENFKKGPAVLSIGKFGNPPQEQRLAELTLGQKDLRNLRGCRPGDCGLKLSAEMMDRLRNSAASLGQGTRLESEFRHVLWGYLSTYFQNGTPAMITYCDSDPPVQSSKVFLDLVGQFAWIDRYAPVLYENLRNSRQSPHPEFDEFFYWSKDDFGLKPVVSVTHVLMLRTMMDGRYWAFLATKQVYADHYFEASLGLTVLAEESPGPANPLISVAYFNRSQTDGLRGWLAPIQRALVERRVRPALAKNLSEMKAKLVKAYRGSAR